MAGPGLSRSFLCLTHECDPFRRALADFRAGCAEHIKITDLLCKIRWKPISGQFPLAAFARPVAADVYQAASSFRQQVVEVCLDQGGVVGWRAVEPLYDANEMGGRNCSVVALQVVVHAGHHQTGSHGKFDLVGIACLHDRCEGGWEEEGAG